MFSQAEIEALELLVKAGMVQPNAPWIQAIPQAKKFIVELAGRLMREQSTEDKPTE